MFAKWRGMPFVARALSLEDEMKRAVISIFFYAICCFQGSFSFIDLPENLSLLIFSLLIIIFIHEGRMLKKVLLGGAFCVMAVVQAEIMQITRESFDICGTKDFYTDTPANRFSKNHIGIDFCTGGGREGKRSSLKSLERKNRFFIAEISIHFDGKHDPKRDYFKGVRYEDRCFMFQTDEEAETLVEGLREENTENRTYQISWSFFTISDDEELRYASTKWDVFTPEKPKNSSPVRVMIYGQKKPIVKAKDTTLVEIAGGEEAVGTFQDVFGRHRRSMGWIVPSDGFVLRIKEGYVSREGVFDDIAERFYHNLLGTMHSSETRPSIGSLERGNRFFVAAVELTGENYYDGKNFYLFKTDEDARKIVQAVQERNGGTIAWYFFDITPDEELRYATLPGTTFKVEMPRGSSSKVTVVIWNKSQTE